MIDTRECRSRSIEFRAHTPLTKARVGWVSVDAIQKVASPDATRSSLGAKEYLPDAGASLSTH